MLKDLKDAVDRAASCDYKTTLTLVPEGVRIDMAAFGMTVSNIVTWIMIDRSRINVLVETINNLEMDLRYSMHQLSRGK